MTKQYTVTILIAGMSVRFVFRNKTMAQRIRTRYCGWVGGRGTPIITFGCRFAVKGCFAKSNDPQVRHASLLNGAILRRDFFCRWEGGRGSIVIRQSIYSFDALVRVLFCSLLPQTGGLFLHASAVTNKKRGAVFAGPSGSGKTTLSRLLANATVLNDEICAVTIGRARQVTVSGTPFWGEMRTGPAHRRRFKMAGIYFLKKARHTAVVKIDKKEAVGRLLSCVCQFGKDALEMARVLEVASAVIESVPVSELRFRRVAHEVEQAVFF